MLKTTQILEKPLKVKHIRRSLYYPSKPLKSSQLLLEQTRDLRRITIFKG